MRYAPKPYAEICADRKAAILAGTKLFAKGSCHMCGWELPKPALYCCGQCALDYEAERVELTAPT